MAVKKKRIWGPDQRRTGVTPRRRGQEGGLEGGSSTAGTPLPRPPVPKPMKPPKTTKPRPPWQPPKAKGKGIKKKPWAGTTPKPRRKNK